MKNELRSRSGTVKYRKYISCSKTRGNGYVISVALVKDYVMRFGTMPYLYFVRIL